MNKMFSMKSSLAKLFVLTSALGFVAGCTDYLNDFEEKYDDGNAFTLPSGNNGDDNGTSSAEDIKSSSSNGSAANATSSSSDGNSTSISSSADKTESSGSNGSSSSSDQPSSAASSSSIRCTGSTIYDARYPDSLGLGFKYSYDNTIIDIKTISSKEGLTLPFTNGVTFGYFVLDKDSSPFDASSWGGLCIEYKPVHSAVMVNITGSDNEAIHKSLPKDSSFVELKWDATDWKNTQGESPKTFDFSHVSSFAIGAKSKPTITRLTILKSGITSVEPISSSSALSSSSEGCTGTVLFSKDKAIREKNGTSYTELNINKAGTYFYSYLGTSNEYYDVTPWQGLCIEYSSSMDFMVSLMRASTQSNQENAIEAEFKLTSTNNSVTTLQMNWNEIYKREEPVYKAILTAANMLKVETYANTGSATINKITAITSEPISTTNTFTVENDMQKQEWFVSAKNTLVTFDNASEQCTSGRLPTLEEIKTLGSILEGKGIASGNETENIYPILVGDLPFKLQYFVLDGSTKVDSFALWTSDKYVVYFAIPSEESNKHIYWKKPTDDLTTKASVRCINK